MRILNVTQTYFPFLEFGGPPVKVRALSKALARRGHQITVLTADWGLRRRLSAGDTADVSRKRAEFGWQVKENGVEAVYLPTWFRYRAVSWNPAVGRFGRERLPDFDVVHIFGLYNFLGPVVAAECRRSRVPYVVEPMGMFLPIVRSFWLKQMYHQLLGRKMLGGCRFLIATSKQECAELISAGLPPEKIMLRRNGVELPGGATLRGAYRRNHGIPGDAKLVLFLGRLSQKKSPDLLLEAFAMLCKGKKVGTLYLAFVGPEERGMRSRLARMAGQLGVMSRVRFGGTLFGEAKWAAYRDADVFVLPSQNENFGNSAAEAAAAGTPVVVTEQCGIAPLLRDVAGLVVRHDAVAVSQAIERILSEPGLHARLSAGCREVTSRLDWEEPAREMEALYKRVGPAEDRRAASLGT